MRWLTQPEAVPDFWTVVSEFEDCCLQVRFLRAAAQSRRRRTRGVDEALSHLCRSLCILRLRQDTSGGSGVSDLQSVFWEEALKEAEALCRVAPILAAQIRRLQLCKYRTIISLQQEHALRSDALARQPCSRRTDGLPESVCLCVCALAVHTAQLSCPWFQSSRKWSAEESPSTPKF